VADQKWQLNKNWFKIHVPLHTELSHRIGSQTSLVGQ